MERSLSPLRSIGPPARSCHSQTHPRRRRGIAHRDRTTPCRVAPVCQVASRHEIEQGGLRLCFRSDIYLHVKRTRAEVAVFEGVIKYGNGRTRPPGQARADACAERASAWDGVDYK